MLKQIPITFMSFGWPTRILVGFSGTVVSLLCGLCLWRLLFILPWEYLALVGIVILVLGPIGVTAWFMARVEQDKLGKSLREKWPTR
jgi:hypothetical protein